MRAGARCRSTPRGSRSRRTVTTGYACAMRIVDAPWPQPTSAAVATGAEPGVDAVELRDPFGHEVSLVAGAEQPLGADEETAVVFVPSDTASGAERVHERVGVDVGRHDAGEAAGQERRAVLVGERERLFGRELVGPRRRVVGDVAAGGLVVEPFAHVPLVGPGLRRERRPASPVRRRPSPCTDPIGRRGTPSGPRSPRRGRRALGP